MTDPYLHPGLYGESQESYIAHEGTGDSSYMTQELAELLELNLPNMYEVGLTTKLIDDEVLEPKRPIPVCPPLPGRYTTRVGERLGRDELLPLVDEWLDLSADCPRFLVQGGNRYISHYLAELQIPMQDLKIMSIDKAPFYNQLMTILSAHERNELLDATNFNMVTRSRAIDDSTQCTRADLLRQFADETLPSPFHSPTRDEDLEIEFDTAIQHISDGSLHVPNLDVIQKILQGTKLAQSLNTDTELHFLDDLFYRGRTLYSLAAIVMAFGGDPQKIKLTTLCCDIKSRQLTGPYHQVLADNKLYPFENSIRTEQGYWQDVGDMNVFTDMGVYWEFLHNTLGENKTSKTYEAWQAQMKAWQEHFVLDGDDPTISMPLIWLSVYLKAFSIEPNIDKIMDQKGYRIGACAPFAQLIDRFISQEEPVEERLKFKHQVRTTLESIQEAALVNPDGFNELVQTYLKYRHHIDYGGLSSLLGTQDAKNEQLNRSMEHDAMVGLLINKIKSLAINGDRPIVVGINGVDGAGKTELTRALQLALSNSKVPVTAVHLDNFTNPAEIRHSSKDAADNYFNSTFDIVGLREGLLDPIMQGRLPKVEFEHADPTHHQNTIKHNYKVESSPSVVLVEGVFLFRAELVNYFDYRIFLRMPLETMLNRALDRDVPKFGLKALVKYSRKYMPAQKKYLDEINPEMLADIIIDCQDWEHPSVTMRGNIEADEY
jgi:uridine kinase